MDGSTDSYCAFFKSFGEVEVKNQQADFNKPFEHIELIQTFKHRL